MLGKKLYHIFTISFGKKRENTNSFVETSITIISMLDYNITRKENCTPISLLNIEVKILGKMDPTIQKNNYMIIKWDLF
jgi:hypothetical protein